MKRVFGNDYVLVTCEGIVSNSDKRLHFVRHGNTYLEAGRPYLIKPSKNVTSLSFRNVSIEGDLFIKEWDDTNKAEKDAAKRAAQEARAKEVLDALKGRRHFGEGDNVVTPDLDQFDSTVVQKQSKYKTADVPFTAALNDSEFKRLRKELSSDSFDISKLPKKQQKLFFAMLNSKMR
jgi:hypothetical protein